MAEYTSDAGRSWTAGTIPSAVASDLALSAVSCATTTDCVAVGQGGVIVISTNGGQSWLLPAHWEQWAEETEGGTDIELVSCATTAHCVAVSFTGTTTGGFYSKNGGRSWLPSMVPGTMSDVSNGLSCPTAEHCVAVGSLNAVGGSPAGVLYTDDGGSSWSEGTVPNGVGYLTGVSCQTVSFCVAGADKLNVPVGSHSWLLHVILVSKNGGASWLEQSLPEGIAGADLVSCGGPKTCVAIGAQGAEDAGTAAAYTANGGNSWSVGRLPPGIPGYLEGTGYPYGPGLTAVSCPAVRECVAVGMISRVVVVTTNGGMSWSVVSHGVSAETTTS